jgi:DTW domain-containing protein YfiP
MARVGLSVVARVVVESCETCARPRAVCVCDRVVSFDTQRRLLILQHPQEQDVLLGTAQLVVASLPKAKLVVGLSWKNLGHAIREEVDVRKWALVFPDREAEAAPGSGQVTTRGGAVLDPAALDGVVVLDGTWSKAKTLYWRNPWLGRMNRLSLTPKQPSIYGKMRREPRREYVSTLESAAAALTLTGEDPAIEAGLTRLFRTMMQRARDAKLPTRS